MSVQQSAATAMTGIESHLKCPICFNIPRDLPIPSCPSGHIVCRPCKERVEDCPTCRQPMPANMTNSLAAALIEQVQHSCKFSDQGCEVKMILKDLVTHEKQCPERAVKCPVYRCGQLVTVSAYDRPLPSASRHSSYYDRPPVNTRAKLPLPMTGPAPLTTGGMSRPPGSGFMTKMQNLQVIYPLPPLPPLPPLIQKYDSPQSMCHAAFQLI